MTPAFSPFFILALPSTSPTIVSRIILIGFDLGTISPKVTISLCRVQLY